MQKLRSNWDLRETLDNGGETPIERGRWSWEGWGVRGRIKEGNTSTDIMYIHDNANVYLNIFYREEGEWEGSWGKPSNCCVYVCHYHYELHYDVILSCTNKSINKTR